MDSKELVIELPDVALSGAIEVKLGDAQIDETANKLIEFCKKVDTGAVGEPAFLMVLYAGQYAYQRTDGVYVVPIGCLRD
jgi:hypothetical protein